MALANAPFGGWFIAPSGARFDPLEPVDLDEWHEAFRATREGDVAAGGRQCRECHCTDNAACPEGCSWTELDLCSACAEAGE